LPLRPTLKFIGALLAVLLAGGATVVLAAGSPQSAPAKKAAITKAALPKVMHVACARAGGGKLQYRPDGTKDCSGTIIHFPKDGPVTACQLDKGNSQVYEAQAKKLAPPAHKHAVVGMLFVVSGPGKCKAPKYPDSHARVLPPTGKDLKLCAGKRRGTVRVVNKFSACNDLEFKVVLKKLSSPAVNHKPKAGDQTVNADEDGAKPITLTGSDPDGDSLTFTIASGPSHGSLTGTGAHRVYHPDSNFTGTDSFTFKVADGHGGTDTGKVTIHVAAVNDPPVVTTSGGSTAYTENGAGVVVDSAVAVTDADDSNLEDAQVVISGGFQAGDQLEFTDQNGITGGYNAGTGILDLTGSASVADYQAALRSIKFSSTSDSPQTPKTVGFRVGDGDDDSGAAATKQVDVTAVNDAPSVNTSSGALAYTEDDGPKAVDSGVTVADPDSANLTGAVVKIASGFSSSEDALAFTNTANITGSYDSGTGVLTLTGTDTVANYQAALRSVTYENSSANPSTTTRTVSFKVTDDGSADSNTATRNIDVTAGNTKPSVTTSAGSSSNTEGSASTIDGALTVADPDDTHLEGATVSIRAADFQSGDVLDFTNTPNISGVYDSGTGVLTLTGHDTVANYQAALRSINFLTNNDAPSSPKRIDFTVNDGDVNSTTATKSVTVTPVNDAPVTDLNGTGTAGFDTTASFTEDSPAASVAPNTDLTDVDDTNLESATITLTNHPDGAAESLAVTTTGTSITASSYNSGTGVLTLSGSDTKANYQQVIRSLTYDNSSDTPDTTDRVVNVKVNDGDVDSNEPHSTISVTAHNDAPSGTDQSVSTNEDTGLMVTLAGTDPEGDSLTFTYDQPSHGTNSGLGSSPNYQPDADYCGPDSFTFHVDDGNGGTDTGTVSITVNCVNDAPVVDLSGTGGFDTTASFTEDSGPASIAAAAIVSDVDDANLESATITLTNHPDGAAESLAVSTAGTSITASAYNSGTGVLTLSGSDTKAHYETVIDSLTYNNTSDTPDTTDRVVNVKVNDGDVDSNEPHVTVSVTANNDAPLADDQSTSTSEDNPVGITLTGSDPEGSAITFASDQPAHGSVSPTNSSSVTYTPDADYCGPDSFTFHTNDGSTDSPNGTVSITVNCVNDAPVVDLNGSGSGGIDNSASFTEDAGATTVAPANEVSDVDNANLASATVTLTNRPDGTAESLAATTSGTSITADAYDNSTGQLFLHGSDTKAHYQQVLRSVVYNNSSQNPDTANRLIDFKVNDGALDSATATTTLSVARANDAPMADDQLALSTNEDTALPITLTGSDIDGDSITFHSDQPAHGSVTPTTGSSITYTPDADYCGPDTFTFHTNDGTVDSANGTIAITVDCVNDAPVVDLNGPAAGTGTSPSFAEQILHTGGATTLAPNGTISDVDDANIESLTVTLTNHPDGLSEFLTADTTGTSITADAYNSSTGVLLLHGTDTKAHYQQVLRTVAYENDAAPPDPTNRVINFVANDGDLDGNTAVSTVSVVPLNAPPHVDLDGSGTPLTTDTTASFTEDSGPATLAPSADVSDADDPNLVSATVTLTNRPDGGAESLSANVTGTSITVDAYVPATGVLFLHGSDTVAHYQQVLRTVAYNNTSDTPTTTNRSITFKVNDGQDDSNTATADTSVTAHNDAPTATDQSVSTNEDTAKGITLSGTDPEGDSLTFTHDSTSANGGTINNPGSASVTYTPAADYCGPDSFNFQVDDGNGGTDSGTVSITVTCVNDAPVVDLNGGGAGIDNNAAFTENQPAVTLATGATVSDVDNANLASATVVLTNHPDGAAEGLTAVTAGTSITADAYDTSTGVLFLHGSDTKANYQQVIRSVAYNNTSDNPDTTNRDVTWKVNDGSVDSATAHTTLSVTAANDPPTLDLNGAGAGLNETAGYTEDQPATTLTPNALASDPDNANLQSATITLTNHPDGAAESLSVDTSGTSISAVAYNSGTGVLSLSGSDTVAHYQQVLRTIAYLNTSQNANTTNRVVNFVANDGSSNSNSPTATVTITVVNDPPVVDMNGGGGGIDSNAAFVEDSSPNVVGSGPVSLGSSATVGDVDNANLASATLTLTNHPDGANESLSVNLAGTSITTGGYNSSTGVLTLTGPDTTAHFQQVIQSAKYNNVSNTPDPTNRDVTIKANDGAADSTVAHTTVTVTPTNDAPVATDETFNATNSAIGNTTLNVNDTVTTGAGAADGRPATPDPTDNFFVTDRPHKEITGNIFANDTDPDNASSGFTATPGTFATNDGGTVTIQSDGDFNFEPAPSTSCTDHSDFFDYTVNDNDPSGDATDTGRVTVAITGCVWYVNNNDAQGNSGTSEKPFDTLAQAQTASGNGDTTFVYDGDDTTTGYNAGYTMNTNETLLSEGATLQIGSDVLHSADAANKASITNNNADVVTLAGGATVKSFNIDPQGTGGGIFGTGLGATTVTLDDLNVVDGGTKGTQPGLELDTNTGTTTNVSNLTVNNGDGSSATTTDAGVKLNNTGTVNFATTGTISITTNGGPGLVASGTGSATSLGSASTFDDITVTNSGAGGVSLNSTTGSGTAFGDGTGNDLQLTTVSGSTAAFSAQTAGSFSVPSAGQSDVSATGGPAVDVVSSSGSTMDFDGVSSTNSANDGINIDSIGTGTFSATSGTIGGEAGTGFDLNGGSGAITYPGTFNNGSGSLVAEVTGRSGGVVSLSGSISDTNDAGGGLNVASNTGGSTVLSGATKQFNTGASDAVDFTSSDGHTLALTGGGTDIDTTSGNGVNATTSGTFQVSGSGNTLDSTALSSGNRGLNISDTDFSATGATFDHVSTSGGTNGIRLNNTGTSGTLFVTGGSGSTADGTGGTIQTTTGNGVDLRGTHKASLEQMNLTNTGDSGSYDDGGELDMNLMNITGAGDAPASAGNPEAGTTWVNSISSSSLTNSTITGAQGNGLDWQPTSGTGTLDVTNDKHNSEGNAGIQLVPPSSANNTTNVTMNVSGGEIKFTPAEGLAATGAGNATVHADVTGVDMANTAALPTNFGVEFNSNTSGHLFARLNNSTIKFAGSSAASAVILDEIQNGQTDVTITNNTIGTPGVNPADIDSGTIGNFGISALFDGDTTNRVDIENNSIAHTDGRPIHLRAHDFSATAGTSNNQITVKNNTMYTPDANNSGITHINGMLVEDEQSNTLCLDATGNHSSHVGTGASDTDIRVSQEDTSVFQLEGFGGNGADPAAVSSFLVAQNPTNFAGATTTASAFIATSFGTSAGCTLPTLP
jgi:hypothetical protein